MTIDSIVLPFMGTREEDHAPFQYILHDINRDQAEILIPKWVVSREKLRVNDLINFHLPFCLNRDIFEQGQIVSSRWDADREALACTACLACMKDALPTAPPIFISITTSGFAIDLREFAVPENVFFEVLRDAALLKKGILIYFNHLIPFFSRISAYPTEEYALLRTSLFMEIRNRINENVQRLEAWSEGIEQKVCTQSDIAACVDLEEYRKVMESEIYSDLFEMTFAEERVMAYIQGIKALEKKLYSHYNTIVMLYIKAI